MLIGTSSTMLATGVAVDPNLAAEFGKWPATVILGAVSMLCVWLIYKQGAKFAEAQKEMATSLSGLVRELSERPCIRKPTND